MSEESQDVTAAAYKLCVAQNGDCRCETNGVGPCVAMVRAAQAEAEAKPKRRAAKAKAKPETGGPELEGGLKKMRAALSEGGSRSITPGGKERVAPVDLPPDCPIKALGKSGRRLFFCDALGQLHELHAEKVGRPTITALFGGATDWLYELWPKWKRVGDDQFVVDDWILARAQETLFEAAHAKGLWEPHLNVRGRGGWRLEDGRLALHCGRNLFVSDGSEKRPGAVDVSGHIYPAAERVAEPMATAGEIPFEGRAASLMLLDLLSTWRWSRDFDARLLLGWIAAGMVGGALKIRPMAWITGPRGSGKSELTGEDGIIDLVLNGGAVLASNTSAAGLYQKLRYDAIPVVLDEVEAKRSDPRTQAVIELMRQGFSGGALLRGGADHGGVEFRARSAMLFSSILIPPLQPQDQSRLAILNLRPFEKDDVEPKIDRDKLRAVGAAMLRRWLTCWSQWPERLDAYRAALKAQGHDGRGQDAFGTLLAAADLMLSDTAPSEAEAAALVEDMGARRMVETRHDGDTLGQCISYAMSRAADRYRGGELMTIGEWVRAALSLTPEHENSNPPAPSEAVRVLRRYGLMPVLIAPDPGGGETIRAVSRFSPQIIERALPKPGEPLPDGPLPGWIGLAFANNGEGILSLFEGSNWEGVPGSRNPYTQALERLPGAYTPAKNVRIGDPPGRCVIVPIQECLDLDDME